MKYDGKLPSRMAEFIRMVLALTSHLVIEVANKSSTGYVIERLRN